VDSEVARGLPDLHERVYSHVALLELVEPSLVDVVENVNIVEVMDMVAIV
jgi:hypothetical protein